MKDWKALTFGVSETINPMRTHLLRLKESPKLSTSHQVALRELSDELKKHRIALDRIKTDYEDGKLRIHVEATEVPIFQSLTRNLSKQRVQIRVQRPSLSLADIRKYRNYLQTFLSVGPHGPGTPPPGEDEAEEVGPQGSGAGEPEEDEF